MSRPVRRGQVVPRPAGPPSGLLHLLAWLLVCLLVSGTLSACGGAGGAASLASRPSASPSPSPQAWEQPLSPSSLPSLQLNMDGSGIRTQTFANMLRVSEAWIYYVGPQGNAPGYTDAQADAIAAGLQVDAQGFVTQLPADTRMTFPVGGYEMGKGVDPGSGQTSTRFLHGVFVLTWKGTGNVYLGYNPGAARLLLDTPGRRVYVVDSAFSGENVYADTIASSDPVHDVKLWAPAFDGAGLALTASSPLGVGQVAGSLEPAPGQPDPLFHPLFLAHLKQCSDVGVLRCMNWLRINWADTLPDDATPITWSDKADPSLGLGSLSVLGNGYNRHGVTAFGGRRLGYPYEWLVEAANQSGKDLWVQVPHTASPDLIANLARLLATRLDPQRRVWFECSNEIWNGAAAYLHQYNTARDLAVTHFGVTPATLTSDQHAWGNGHLQGLTLQLFEQAWKAAGGSDDRLINVVSGWAASANYTQKVLDAVREVDPALPEVLAITNYAGEWIQSDLWALYTFGSSPGAWPAVLVDQMLAIQRRNLQTCYGWWKACGDVAHQYGMPMVAYEGGESMGYFGFSGSQAAYDDFAAFMHAFKYSPQEAAFCREMYALWSAAGGRTAAQYTDCGIWSFWGDWGAKEYISQTRLDSVRWDSLCTWGETQRGIRAPYDPVGSAPAFDAVTLHGEVALAFDASVTATGGNGTVGFSVLGGALPPGLALQAVASGVVHLVGTPTLAGHYAFVLRAWDADGDVCDRPCAVDVDPQGLSTSALVVFRGADLPVSQQGQGRYDPTPPTQTLDGGARLCIPYSASTPMFAKDGAAQWGFPGDTLDPTSPLTMYGAFSVTSIASAHGMTRTGPPAPQTFTGLRQGQFISFSGDPNGPSLVEDLAVWQTSQFKALGGVGNYCFDAKANLHVDLTSLQNNGSGSDNELRFVVVNRDGQGQDTWYLSEAACTTDRVPLGGFGVAGFNNSATPGLRWAPMTPPTGTTFSFPTSGLVFGPVDFTQVQAVGLFYRGAGYGGTFSFDRFYAIGGRH